MVRGVLGLHILLALFFMIGGWVHINYLGYEWWVFVAIGLWGIDRIVRVLRMISFGFPEADITLMSDETLKIKIPRPDYWEPIPGGHIFITFLRKDCFWQSHPFTFAPQSRTPTPLFYIPKSNKVSLVNYTIILLLVLEEELKLLLALKVHTVSVVLQENHKQQYLLLEEMVFQGCFLRFMIWLKEAYPIHRND